jgi:hypothetical protein
MIQDTSVGPLSLRERAGVRGMGSPKLKWTQTNPASTNNLSSANKSGTFAT